MIIDCKELKQQCSGRWFGILTSVGVPPKYLTGKHTACPVCGGKDRFRWDDKNGDGTWFCNQCSPQSGDGFILIQKYCNMSFLEAVKQVQIVLGGCKMENNTNNVPDIEKTKKFLNELWTASKPLLGSDPVCKYLHKRKLVLQPDFVRYCPQCYESETKQSYPAMIAKIVNKDGQPVCLHRIYLADIPKKKKLTPTLEPLSGCAIRLFPAKNDKIGIAEGIETAIACKQLFDIPTWACISSTIMEGFEPPEGIRQVTIYGDSDANFVGQESAYKLASRLYKKDIIVNVEIPIPIGKDWNDILVDRIE